MRRQERAWLCERPFAKADSGEIGPRKDWSGSGGPRGFTLIELLVVMVIIGLLGALVVPRLFKNVGKGKITATKAQIAAFQTALGAYKLDVGTFPSSEEGLQALRTKPVSANHWDGPYLPKEIPVDPWGNPYVYKFPGEHGDEPDIISYGADGREGGEGENADVLSWK